MLEPDDLLVDETTAEALRKESLGFPSLTLDRRQLCDLELLLNGAFAPLQGFMGPEDWEAVVRGARLADGRLWPIPITLEVSPAFAEGLSVGDRVALRDAEGFMPAVLEVESIWEPDRRAEAEGVYGTTSMEHPGVARLLGDERSLCLGGRVLGMQLPAHHDFESLWDTPRDLHQLFHKRGWRRVLAVHSSRPLHRLERELILEQAREAGTHILLHPAVGPTKPGDLQYYARVRCYKAIRQRFPHDLAMLSLLPLAMRMAGPREALWHALVNRNYGCSHFLVGPDHASPPRRQDGGRFYPPGAAQEYAASFAEELGMEILTPAEYRYVPARRRFLPLDRIEAEGLESETLSPAELKTRLTRNQEIPEWFSYPEVLDQLRLVYPPRSRQGFTLFFTGLSGSGKSTLANILFAKLVEYGSRPVSLLDGDIVRQNLSSELGFSKRDRDINIRRIGFVASEITKNGGVAICAPIAPYAKTRQAVRELIEQGGAYIEIHVSTPLEVCEQRDRKGLYAKARKGIIKEFTGISDPYEVPEDPELRIDTSTLEPAEAAQEILLYLFKEGFLDEE